MKLSLCACLPEGHSRATRASWAPAPPPPHPCVLQRRAPSEAPRVGTRPGCLCTQLLQPEPPLAPPPAPTHVLQRESTLPQPDPGCPRLASQEPVPAWGRGPRGPEAPAPLGPRLPLWDEHRSPEEIRSVWAQRCVSGEPGGGAGKLLRAPPSPRILGGSPLPSGPRTPFGHPQGPLRPDGPPPTQSQRHCSAPPSTPGDTWGHWGAVPAAHMAPPVPGTGQLSSAQEARCWSTAVRE